MVHPSRRKQSLGPVTTCQNKMQKKTVVNMDLSRALSEGSSTFENTSMECPKTPRGKFMRKQWVNLSEEDKNEWVARYGQEEPAMKKVVKDIEIDV